MLKVRFSALRSTIYSVASIATIGLLAAISAGAQTPAAQSRITQAIDETNLVTLKGNTHPLARAQYDQGAAPDNEPANRIMILLKRNDAQEASLRQFLDGQKSGSSPNFHQWLTPAQFGAQFGPSDSDIQTLTTWLTSHGFTVNRVSAGRTLIEISGTAGAVRQTFHTEIHKYVVNGESHWANNSDPQIPAALAPVMAGPVTLHNFGRKAMHVKTGTIHAAIPTSGAKPQLTGSGCTNTSNQPVPCYVVGPSDFAEIYNTQPLLNAGINGTGQTIAIVGDSDINCSDAINFRKFFGLPTVAGDTCSASNSNVQIFTNGPDPGFNGDEIEADLDVQWSGAVAQDAHIDFVTSETTEVSEGVDLSAEYIIDNDLAPVMSESFGACEEDLGNAGNSFYSQLWEQAAAEGITVMTSSGDSGAAGCDDDNVEDVAVDGLAVSGISSTPFNISVGGTDFEDFGIQTTYWNPAPVGGNVPGTSQQSVKANTYIPEVPWNDSCASNTAATSAADTTAALAACGALNASNPTLLLNIVGGGGGQSNCAEVSRDECEGYAKPSWQSGGALPSGNPASTDGFRDVPDVALFAAAGSGSDSFYPICQSDVAAPCTTLNPVFSGVGGTSSSSPAFAGIMAMVNQYMASQSLQTRQGNANYELYSLASTQTTAPPSGGCNSTSSPNAASTTGCTFYDVTIGSNSVPCITGFGCTNQNGNSVTPGVLEEINSVGNTDGILAWQAGTGYDLSTGLGSVNAYNLVHNWPSAVGKFTPTATTLKLCSPTTTCVSSGTGGTLTITHGATVTVTTSVAPTSGSGTPTGNVTLLGTLNGNLNAGIDYFAGNSEEGVFNLDVYTLTGGTITGNTNSLLGGDYAVTARYAGDGTFGASTSPSSPAVNVAISPEASTTTVSLGVADPSTGDFVNSTAYGLLDYIRVDVVGTASTGSNLETASGTVNVTDDGSSIGCPNPCSLNSEGNLEIQAGVSQIPTLTTGAHSFVATYLGDASYSGSASSPAATLTVTPAPTVTTVSVSPTSVTAGHSTTLTAAVTTDSIGVAPTGNVTFFASGTAITTGTVTYVRTAGSLQGAPGTGNGAGLASVTASLTYTPSASTTITATYTADANYATSTSLGVPLTAAANYSLSSANSSSTNAVVIATQGASGAATIGVTLSAGTTSVMLAATLTVSPSGAIDTPTCMFAPNPVTASGNVTMTCTTTAANVPPAPTSRPTPRGTPLTWLWAAIVAALAILWLVALPQRRRGYALLIFVVLVAAGVGVACGGGGGGTGGGGGGGGGGGAVGTTIGLYEYTVSGTPAGGTTTVWFNVE